MSTYLSNVPYIIMWVDVGLNMCLLNCEQFLYILLKNELELHLIWKLYVIDYQVKAKARVLVIHI